MNYLVSFIGFAPVEDPQLVIYCVVDEPNVAEQFHSTYAQNIVREILEEVLPYMNIYRDEDTTGIHEGWGIKGEDEGDVGDVTAADVANSTARRVWMCRIRRMNCRKIPGNSLPKILIRDQMKGSSREKYKTKHITSQK